MRVINTSQIEKERITRFFTIHWGSPQMVISSGTYHCDQLHGFAVIDEQNEIVGLLTYMLEGNECEIISLDSVIEKIGVGTNLLQSLEDYCSSIGIKRIRLITTNDNLHALGFYQKRGYVLNGLFLNAVAEARKRKPSIPLIAHNGIPIRDELQLIKEIK